MIFEYFVLLSVIIPLIYAFTIYLNKMVEILEKQNGFFTKLTLVIKKSVKRGAVIPMILADTIAILAFIIRCYIALHTF